jgi:hypothetical protein
MSVASIGTRDAAYSALLSSQLQARGLSAQKTALVLGDAKVALEKVQAVRNGPPDKAAIRDALESRIAADVASGKLTEEDAKTVNATLDQIDPKSPPDQQPQGPAGHGGKGGGPHGGGGEGGGGAANKTELSETVTVTGKLKKTTILYTDGTSESTTTVLTDSVKDSKYIKSPVYDLMKASAETTGADAKTRNYLSTLDPGSLFNFTV